jgi:hypothetical protein
MATARKWRCELGYSLTEFRRCCDSDIPRPTAKRSPGRAGAKLRRKTQAETRKVGNGADLPASHSGLEFSPGCRRRSDWPGTAKFRGSSWRRRRGSPARSAPLRRPGRSAPEPITPRQCGSALHVIDRNKGDSVGAVEHKGHLAVMQTGLQVDYLACAELKQLFNGHLAQRVELR